MIFPNPKMLVYIAIGDACAIPVEYLTPEEADPILKECLLFKRYLEHPRYKTGAGNYTDDTEMSLANAQVLTKHDPPFTPIMFANEYVLEFERGGRRNGYSRRFQKLLEEVRDGTELIARIEPHSYYNGAAMRAVPLGVLPTIEMVLAAAETQAKISHDTPDGIFSARAVALMSHYALYEPNSLKGLYAYCLKHLPTEDSKLFDRVFKTRWPGVPVVHTKTSSVAVNTVHAVIDLVAYQPSLMSILRQTLVWGGDTDSVAAIAWGIASCRYQNEALPSFMRTDLEAAHPSTKVHYLERIGAALMKKYA